MKLKTEPGSNFFTLGEIERVGENETREKWKQIYNTTFRKTHDWVCCMQHGLLKVL